MAKQTIAANHCTNLSTAQAVFGVPPTPITWDCVGEGLVVSLGNVVRTILFAVAN